ncbi:GSCFA domain-containing protein [Fulvivirgaceae bacterium BMA10]|uniref:GSCFA domain-containing protein n=1 Tax=Splendidivirga corallicola TaxID=3051826 RepID=A0ABT8KGY3_9BACT|nr:GSCFA domain-containing protein [Fulvivirgaceae bacterium BMA10]
MFRTEVNIAISPSKIDLQDKLLSIGSCFAESIGGRLISNKFKACVNPYGVIFNPVSIFNLLSDTLQCVEPEADSYVKSEGVYFNYNFHSDLSNLDENALKSMIENAQKNTNELLKSSRWLIITLGTAVVYKRVDNGHIVANCHKVPATSFSKCMLEPDEILDSFNHFFSQFQKVNDHCRIILTVSPVRHIKDTLEVNALSKAILRTAAEKIRKGNDKIDYFPAYEMMIDDLRDYRFYKSDMIHPTETAEDYIWEAFGKSYFDTDTQLFLKEWRKIKKALSHRPFHPESDKHQKFLKETIQKLEKLQGKITVDQEIAILNKQLL